MRIAQVLIVVVLHSAMHLFWKTDFKKAYVKSTNYGVLWWWFPVAGSVSERVQKDEWGQSTKSL